MAPLYLITHGDSLTSGVGATNGQTWPYQLALMYSDRMVSITNAAVAGSIYGNLNISGPSVIDTCYDARKKTNIVIAFGGINDFIGNRPPSQVYTSVQLYCADRRAAGFKVIVCTVTPCSSVGTASSYEANRQALNVSLRANYRTFADGLVDFAADSRIGPAGAEADTTYYATDLVHMNNKGYSVLAALIKPVVDSLL